FGRQSRGLTVRVKVPIAAVPACLSPRVEAVMTFCRDGVRPMTRVAIAGLGTIGRALARALADGIAGLSLACAPAGDRNKAQAWLDGRGIACPLVDPVEFPELADLAVECAPASAIDCICRPMLGAGKKVMVLSAGALLERPDLIALAKDCGGQIIVPTGAL